MAEMFVIFRELVEATALEIPIYFPAFSAQRIITVNIFTAQIKRPCPVPGLIYFAQFSILGFSPIYKFSFSDPKTKML